MTLHDLRKVSYDFPVSSVYDAIIGLLKQHGVAYEEFDHEPILNYDDAEKQKQHFGWTGTESKNVFMKGGDGKYYVFVTFQGQRVDFKKLKEVLGVKLSIASEDDVRNVVQCVPGCVAPFGFSSDITILLDPTLFTHTDYLFSPGVTTKTIRTNVQDLKKVFDGLPNPVIKM